jgi:hypothetical protein
LVSILLVLSWPLTISTLVSLPLAISILLVLSRPLAVSTLVSLPLAV